MIYLFAFLFILILVGCFIWRRGKKPYKHRDISQDHLKQFLEVLLFRGYEGGFLCIEIPDDHRFLQFSKYVAGKDSVGLQFDFPLAAWSRAYFEPLKRILNEERIKFEIQKTVRKAVPEFLLVDVEQDLELALRLAKLTLQSVYGLDESQHVDLYFENVNPRDEKIGF